MRDIFSSSSNKKLRKVNLKVKTINYHIRMSELLVN